MKYVEGWNYNNQTQHTGQTISPFAVMSARLKIAHKLAEIPHNILTNTSSPSTKDITCYNLFLIKNNLPILPSNQTLKSFLQHLTNNLFKGPFKISINTLKHETHVYINTNDFLLPNHILLNSYQYSKYYNTPILSYNTPFSSILTDNLFYNNQNPSNNIYNSKITPSTPIPTLSTLSLKQI